MKVLGKHLAQYLYPPRYHILSDFDSISPSLSTTVDWDNIIY